jgi:hypothetical protein
VPLRLRGIILFDFSLFLHSEASSVLLKKEIDDKCQVLNVCLTFVHNLNNIIILAQDQTERPLLQLASG